jgi:two-component system, NtrC family, response regulator
MRKKRVRILFIEDDKSGRELGVYNLEKAGYQVDSAVDGEDGLKKFSPYKYQLVITDLKMPGISGMEVLNEIHGNYPEIPVLVITAFGNIDVAVEAMKYGAYDFITKPFNKDHLVFTIERALEKRELANEVKDLKIKASGIERDIIYKSETIKKKIHACERFANSDASVLIAGESGTGKELFARLIHVKSPRASMPFIPINCAAIPPDLLESELFGHEKGAFTGAHVSRKGKFRQAAGGTVFLDEISELPIFLQSKILRVLQEKEVNAVGGEETHSIDVRFVSATNKDLLELIDKGEFREDLYYRLNVVDIELPPLRERKEDIEPLVKHFVNEISNDRSLIIPEPLIKELEAYNWPGNIRELQNVCERLVLLCQGNELSATDLPRRKQHKKKTGGSSINDPGFLEIFSEDFSILDLEKQVMENALEYKEWNITKTADFLGIPRHILAYRMEKYGIVRNSSN